MKHGGRELLLAGTNRGQRGAKILLGLRTGCREATAVSRRRNLSGVDAMILRHENFGKGWKSRESEVGSQELVDFAVSMA
jgi:hypothetical protein